MHTVYICWKERKMMKNHIIHKLRKDIWKGTLLPIEYTSKEYYDVNMQRTDDGFQISIQKKKFTKPFIHSLEDCEYQDKLYEDWWEDAEAFGIIEDNKLLAAIEICPESWTNRLIITELFVDEKLRGQGYGKKLLDIAKKITVDKDYRTLILETQSSNINAVDFYLHEGFTLIGFDSCCYTNTDLERKEVRLNMGWFPINTK